MRNTAKAKRFLVGEEDESYWLTRAKRELMGRDPLDALNDAEALLAFASERWFDLVKDYASEDEVEKLRRSARVFYEGGQQPANDQFGGPLGPDDREG